MKKYFYFNLLSQHNVHNITITRQRDLRFDIEDVDTSLELPQDGLDEIHRKWDAVMKIFESNLKKGLSYSQTGDLCI